MNLIVSPFIHFVGAIWGYNNKQIGKIMRLTSLLLLIGVLHVSARTNAQKVTIESGQITLHQAITIIEQQTGYSFIAEKSIWNKQDKIDVHIRNATVREALNTCLHGLPYTYSIEGNIIKLLNKSANPADAYLAAELPLSDIHGHVLDSLGRPIENVTVAVKGTKRIVFTDKDGYYSLSKINDRNTVLIFSFIGYTTQEVATYGKEELNITLKELNRQLDDINVMVSTGYQTISKQRMTGAISTLDRKSFNSRITTESILDGMQGKLAGVLINNDIQFKENNLFQVRGLATMSGNATPLIVLDGYPTNLTINQINPNEIESITVLKDAAAASIYGTRASNGVIVINRIKGVKGKVNTQLISTLSITPPTNYTRFKYAPSSTYLNFNYEKFAQNLLTINRESTYNNSTYTFNSGLQPVVQYLQGNIDSTTMIDQLATIGRYNNASEYSRLFLRPTVNQQYYLNISGGSDNINYFIAGSFSKKNLERKNDRNSSSSISSRFTIKFNKKLSFDINEDINYNLSKTSPVPSYTSLAPYEHLVDNDGNALPVLSLSKVNPYYNRTMMTKGYLDHMVYPYKDFQIVTQNTNYLSNRISGRLNYSIKPNLIFTLFSIFELQRQQMDVYYPVNSSQARNLINAYTEVDDDGYFNYNIPKGGYANSLVSSMGAFTSRAQVTYDPVIGKNQLLNIILGGEINKAVSKTSSSYVFGYDDNTLIQSPVDYNYLNNFYSDTYPYSYLPLSIPTAFAKTYTDNRTLSGYFNLVYTYKSKYTFSGSARVDQSNLFGTNKKYKYKPLWSVGGAWLIDREDFLINSNVITALKLRFSSGFNGNVAKNSIPEVIAKYNTNLFNYSVLPSLDITSLANTQLRWEQTYNFNIGTDWTFFKKWNLSIDYYQKNASDVLGSANIDPTNGTNSAIINSANITNKGFEFALHSDWITTPKFNWNTGLILSLNSNKVTKSFLSNTYRNSAGFLNNLSASQYVQGYPISTVFAYRSAGLSEQGFPVVYSPSNEVIRLGGYIPNPEDKGRNLLQYMGSTIPKMTIGFSNRLDISNFYFYCMFNLYSGFVQRMPPLNPNVYHPFAGSENYFKKAGDQTKTDIMGIYSGDYIYTSDIAVYNNLDRNVVNGSYLTLNDATMGYTFSDKVFKPMELSNVNIKLQATNIWTVGFNKYNYSIATGNFAKRYLTPTYTIGIFANL